MKQSERIKQINTRINEIRKNPEFLDFDNNCTPLISEYNDLRKEKIKLEFNNFVDYSSNKGGLNYNM